MYKFKKVIAFITAIAILIAVPAVAFAAEAAAGVEAKMEKIAGKDDIYKLVFRARTDTVITTLAVVFSFDNELIVPVQKANPYGDSDWSALINNNSTTAVRNGPIKNDSDYFMNAGGTKWSDAGSRSALYTTMAAPYPVESNGNYVDVFEFYFRLDGDIDQVNANTFKFENAEDSPFITKFNPSIAAGVSLFETASPSNTYCWGASAEEKAKYQSVEKLEVKDEAGDTLWTPSVDPDVEAELILKSAVATGQDGKVHDVTAGFTSPVQTNVAYLTFEFDSDVFSYEGYELASEVTKIDEEISDGKLWIVVMSNEGKFEDISDICTIKLRDNTNGAGATGNVTLNYGYVVYVEDEKVEVWGEYGIGIDILTGTFSLIDLSNIVEVYGDDRNEVDEGHWNEKCAQWDFYGTGVIDIQNVSFVARNIPRA